MIERSFKIKPDAPVPTGLEAAVKPHKTMRQWRLIALVAFLAVVATATSGWLLITRPWVYNPNPFTPAVAASVQFPLYYPTKLPTGYRVDAKSVTQPQAGVVVFEMKGPKGAILYASEEARPVSYDLGGFYKTFAGLKELPVSDGAIASGKLNNGRTEIVSRANNKTWILCNTTAPIPMDQLTNMLSSIAVNS
jgi:hypothetical protein